ncbi:MAG: hypothetical protein ACREFM_01250 [Hypericibacter sp.]
MAVSRFIARWCLVAAVAFLALWPGLAAFAQDTGDVFSSSGGGRSCGSPGYRYDMSKVEDAAKGYPNSRILILTPQEKRDLEDKLAAQDPRSGATIVEMAPCFNCSQEYEACILFSRGGPIPGGDEFGSNTPPSPGGDEYGSNGGNTPPTSGGDEEPDPNGPLGPVLYGACPVDYANMDKPGLTPEMHYALGFSQAARKCMADTVTIWNLGLAAAAAKFKQVAAILIVVAAPQVIDGVLHPPGVSTNPDPYLQGREEGKRLCEWGLKVSPVLVARCPAKSPAKALTCTAAQAHNGYGVAAGEIQANAPTRTDCFPCSLAWLFGEHYTPPANGKYWDLAVDIIPMLKQRFGNLIPQGPELPCWRQLAQSKGMPGSMSPTAIEQEMLAAGDGAKGVMLWKGPGEEAGHVIGVKTVGNEVQFRDEQQLMDGKLWFPTLEGKWVTFYRVQ